MSYMFPSVRDGLYLKDDFLVDAAVATGTVGELDWVMTTIANASTAAYLVTTDTGPGVYGVLRDTTAATANGDGEAYTLLADTVVLGGNLPGFFRFRARLHDQIAGNYFRIGLDDSVTATDGTVGIWVASVAGVISLIAASNDHGDVTAAAANVATFTAGTTMVLDTWHEFEVRWSGNNVRGGPLQVVLYVDGHLAAEINNCEIDDDEEMEPSIVHWNLSGGALAVELDVDYFELFISRSK